ncbi:class I SAM-dependent methyltransferase [Streptomyces sp. NPDC048644]|uniref:class I SAM-dependent methyltransferase n=1 Tax=Streptomyces sp. NPDC048644 TaxID=3365582 RepID=UPI003719668D
MRVEVRADFAGFLALAQECGEGVGHARHGVTGRVGPSDRPGCTRRSPPWHCSAGAGDCFPAGRTQRGEGGDEVLGVGCGTGYLTRPAAAAVAPGGTALGVAPSPSVIAYARRHSRRRNVSFEAGVGEALGRAEGSFDVVVSGLAVASHSSGSAGRPGRRCR